MAESVFTAEAGISFFHTHAEGLAPVILLAGTASSTNVSGGANGVTLNTPGVAYGATSGGSGFTLTSASPISSPGPHSASICTDVGITKLGTPDPVLQNATLTYTLTVTNNGPQAATTITVVDTLPTAVSFVSAAGLTDVRLSHKEWPLRRRGRLLSAALKRVGLDRFTPAQLLITARSPGAS